MIMLREKEIKDKAERDHCQGKTMALKDNKLKIQQQMEQNNKLK